MRSARLGWFVCSLVLLAGCSSSDSPTGPVPIPTNGLLAFYSFSGNAADLSGSGNDGTLLGGAVANGALVMGNNATDMLQLPGSVMDGLGDFTFSAWLRIDVLRNNSHEVISGANALQDNAVIFWYREHTDEWVFGVNNGGSAFPIDSRIEDVQWHHVVLTRAGTVAHLYLDGVELGSGVTVGGDLLDVDVNGLVFGQDQDSLGGGFMADQSWAGAMDNLRIYDRAVSLGEVQALAGEAH